MQFGCIGETLQHSFSKEIHEKLGYPYELKELPPQALDAFMRRRDFQAINVTIPYKEKVIPFLDVVDETAQAIGAVNTILNREGKLWGYNTDFYGLKALLEHAKIDVRGKAALIFGTGGTSKTVWHVLKALGAKEIVKASRTGKDGALSYAQAAERGKDFQIIINASPQGMYPHAFDLSADLSAFPCLEGYADAVYNPLRPWNVLAARERSLPAEGGLYMLVAQAMMASRYFTGREDVPNRTEEIFQSIQKERENIVLIGMPYSGKSSVGRALRALSGRTLVDSDLAIEEKTGRKPGDIITQDGEAAFRRIETEVIRELSLKTGVILATGGGAVLREENVRALRMNGRIYFLDRPKEKLLPTASRPLTSTAEALEKKYAERYPVYSAVCDAHIPTSDTQPETAKRILKEFEER